MYMGKDIACKLMLVKILWLESIPLRSFSWLQGCVKPAWTKLRHIWDPPRLFNFSTTSFRSSFECMSLSTLCERMRLRKLPLQAPGIIDIIVKDHWLSYGHNLLSRSPISWPFWHPTSVAGVSSQNGHLFDTLCALSTGGGRLYETARYGVKTVTVAVFNDFHHHLVKLKLLFIIKQLQSTSWDRATYVLRQW